MAPRTAASIANEVRVQPVKQDVSLEHYLRTADHYLLQARQRDVCAAAKPRLRQRSWLGTFYCASHSLPDSSAAQAKVYRAEGNEEMLYKVEFVVSRRAQKRLA